MVKIVDGWKEEHEARERYLRFHNLAVGMFTTRRVSSPEYGNYPISPITIYEKSGTGKVISLNYLWEKIEVNTPEHFDEAKTLAEKCEELTGENFVLKTMYPLDQAQKTKTSAR